MSEILRFCDSNNLQKNAADLIASCLNNVLSSKGTAVLAICGGRSVAGILADLAEKAINWSRVHIFLADERCVPLNSPDSNFRLAQESALDKMVAQGIIPAVNLHPFVLEGSFEQSLEHYNDQIREYGGRFDVVLLSIGEDGHIASLFPHHDSIMDDSSEYYISVSNSPKPPSERISASKNMLRRSGYAIVLATGKAKKRAFEAMLNELLTEIDCPARLFRVVANSYVLTDIDTCGGL